MGNTVECFAKELVSGSLGKSSCLIGPAKELVSGSLARSEGCSFCLHELSGCSIGIRRERKCPAAVCSA